MLRLHCQDQLNSCVYETELQEKLIFRNEYTISLRVIKVAIFLKRDFSDRCTQNFQFFLTDIAPKTKNYLSNNRQM